MRLFFTLLLIHFVLNSFSQEKEFTTIILNQTTTVKDQGETGSCWSYAACSFFESELFRTNKGEYDLSEGFLVYNAYLNKGRNYFLRQSKTNFTTGGLSHDAIRIINDKGIVPDEFYKGEYLKDGVNDYFELNDVLEAYLNSLLKIKNPSEYWMGHYEDILISYLGEVPETLEINDKKVDPLDFSKDMGLRLDNYISFTSFTHHPFYSNFILEIPDNYSNGEFYNLPIDSLVEIIDTALMKGFTFIWDGDVSEPTFSTQKKGLAMLPDRNEKGELIFEIGSKEIISNQEQRQTQFEKLLTTDDHLMHCVGLAKSKNGTKFYIMKNSWGEVGPFDGYTYMSESYLRMKTISIMLNKNGLEKPEGLTFLHRDELPGFF